jgi:membrane protein YqaA with SNARE-associated domain
MIFSREREIGLGSALISVVMTAGPAIEHIVTAIVIAVLATAASKMATWTMDQWHEEKIKERAARREESRRRKIADLKK